ncbi:hypothetical protein HMPREF1219_00147 [Corynebacterium pyruviciproducens ATCC BAA-1742]|uniref:Uncharacterized protein n=1 Tax=Corynebacterium pyruviciproducens ATCC BAA-1742 TaxID=1125779 RepID=S2ZLI1_9CORY|nr:hypothetical protein [Corynebacterium pyruviciproducens]EPD70852.1 hypothetical protein HMPREF1219_00147 [Corynebacterium pyruviciproducens ATCC BAA-1742]
MISRDARNARRRVNCALNEARELSRELSTACERSLIPPPSEPQTEAEMNTHRELLFDLYWEANQLKNILERAYKQHHIYRKHLKEDQQ